MLQIILWCSSLPKTWQLYDFRCSKCPCGKTAPSLASQYHRKSTLAGFPHLHLHHLLQIPNGLLSALFFPVSEEMSHPFSQEMYHLCSHISFTSQGPRPLISFLFFIFTHSLSALSTPPQSTGCPVMLLSKTQKWTNNCEGEVNPQSTPSFTSSGGSLFVPTALNIHLLCKPPTSNPPFSSFQLHLPPCIST